MFSKLLIFLTLCITPAFSQAAFWAMNRPNTACKQCPTIVQKVSYDGVTSPATAVVNFSSVSQNGNTLVVALGFNPNGNNPEPVPTSPRVTFVECELCSAGSGASADEFRAVIYYALNAPPTSSVTIATISGPVAVYLVEVKGATGLDTGANFAAGYGPPSTSSAAYTTTHPNVLLVGVSFGGAFHTATGELAGWSIFGIQLDNDDAGLWYTTQANAGNGALTGVNTDYSRPTIAVAAFY